MLRGSILRRIAVYTEQNAILQNNATALKFASNLWVEGEDKYWTDKLTPLKPEQKPVSVFITRTFSLFNIDQLQNVASALRDQANVAQHTSVKAMVPYKDKTAKMLDTHATMNGYNSKLWVTPAEAAKRGWLVKPGKQRPVSLAFNGEAKLFNAEQFVKPELINEQTFSGATKKPFGKDMHETLKAYAAKHHFKSGLFFSQRQVDDYGLAIKPDASGVVLPTGGGNNTNQATLYNVTQLVNYKQLLDTLQRFPVAEPTFLISGRPLFPEFRSAVDAANRTYESNYWVTDREVLSRSWELVADAAKVHPPSKVYTFKMYNVFELHKPELGFKMAGTIPTGGITPAL